MLRKVAEKEFANGRVYALQTEDGYKKIWHEKVQVFSLNHRCKWC